MRLTIESATRALSDGEVVAVPTQTFYGLAARADSHDAVERVFALKGRRPALPSPCLVASVAAAQSLLDAPLSSATQSLMRHFWPGALTVVVPGARAGLSPGIVGPGGAIGLRQDGHPELARLLDRCGFAVTGTSANRSGDEPCRLGEAVDRLFAGREGYAGHVGQGPTQGSAASTVVEVNGWDLRVLRHGALEPAEVLRIWAEVAGAADDD